MSTREIIRAFEELSEAVNDVLGYAGIDDDERERAGIALEKLSNLIYGEEPPCPK